MCHLQHPTCQDVLIQNSDRHAGHFLVAEHWADGAYTNSHNNNKPKGSGSNTGIGDGGVNAHWRGRMSPVLIDHAAGFRHDAFVCLDHENAFLTGEWGAGLAVFLRHLYEAVG